MEIGQRLGFMTLEVFPTWMILWYCEYEQKYLLYFNLY